MLLFRKSSLWGCYYSRHVTNRDVLLFINSKSHSHKLKSRLVTWVRFLLCTILFAIGFFLVSTKDMQKKVGSCKTNSTQPHFTSVVRHIFTSIELFSKRVYKLGVTFMRCKENFCNDDECTVFLSMFENDGYVWKKLNEILFWKSFNELKFYQRS